MDIKPESKTLEKILAGLDTSYHVPEYQRDYSWTSDEVETLWVDLNNSLQNENEYFMGTLVLKKRSDENEDYEIVDGQQRLATFSVLFSVFQKIAVDFESEPSIFNHVPRNDENKQKAEKLRNISLQRLREVSEPDNYFLRLNKKDGETFERIVKSNRALLPNTSDLDIVKNESRLRKTEKILFRKIYEAFSGVDALKNLYELLIQAVKKLKFITIEVKTDYDAFLLFESLNSKGMDLSVSDLVKNKLLMHTEKDDKDSVLENWEEMMAFVGSSKVNSVDFLRIYWESIKGVNTTKKELYKYVSSFIESTEVKVFSESLKNHSECMSQFADKALIFPECMHSPNLGLRACGEIGHLKYTLCYPILLYSFMHRPELFDRLAKLSLSFLFRWITICDYSVGGAKKVFDDVLKELRQEKQDKDVLNPFFNEMDKVGDEKFVADFGAIKIFDNSLAKYILAKVFIHEKDGDAIPNYSEVQLEHVLPQKPEKWVEDNFAVPEGTQIKDWIFNPGNFILLNKKINASIQNKLFKDKVEKYSDSIFPDTNEVYQQYSYGQEWSTDWILKRSIVLTDKVAEIWPLKSF